MSFQMTIVRRYSFNNEKPPKLKGPVTHASEWRPSGTELTRTDEEFEFDDTLLGVGVLKSIIHEWSFTDHINCEFLENDAE